MLKIVRMCPPHRWTVLCVLVVHMQLVHVLDCAYY